MRKKCCEYFLDALCTSEWVGVKANYSAGINNNAIFTTQGHFCAAGNGKKMFGFLKERHTQALTSDWKTPPLRNNS